MAQLPMPLQMTSCALRTSSFHRWASMPLPPTYRRTSVLLTQLVTKPVPARSLYSSKFLSVKVPEVNKLAIDTCLNCSIRNPRNTDTVRFYSSAKPKPSPQKDKALQETSQSRGGAVTLSTAEKVKENVKTVSYGGVIVVGVLIGGAMLYYVFNELFSSESPNNIYSHAFKMCKLSNEVQDALGSPIKCYGEETRRGWRRHVAYQEFLAGQTQFLRMRFYIEGQFKKGTVNVEKKKNDRGKYEYTYISVDIDGYPPRRIEVPF